MFVLMPAILALYLLYFIMVLLFFVGIVRIKKSVPLVQNSKISLSVVVALRNEELNVDLLLNSLLLQNYSSENFEIVLVNDHSTDLTWAKLKAWTEKHNNITLIDLPIGQEGKKQAIALGVNQAKFDIIVLTDADCTHPKSWLQSMSNRFSETDANFIIGPVMLSHTNSFFEQMQALEHCSLTASTLGACGLGLPFMASSANLAFNKRRLAFNAQMLNPSQSSGDDVFLLHSAKRLKNNNIQCVRSKTSLVYSKTTKSFIDFLRQRARWASKASAYRDPISIAVALVVFIFNLVLLALLVSAFFAPTLWPLLAIGFAVKVIVDLPLLWIYLKQYHLVSLLKVFVPLQLVYPIYVLATICFSIIGKFEWKGRGDFKSK